MTTHRIIADPHHTNPILGSLTLSHPTSSSIEPVLNKGEQITLGGKVCWDTTSRKYKYTLVYEMMDELEYNALEAVVNVDTVKAFTYARYPQATGINVWAYISTREPIAYRGHQQYYSNVTLVLHEQANRA